MRISCIGISHRTAEVALREKLSFDAAQARSALRCLAREYPQAEFLLLSTCNRVELYVAREAQVPPTDRQVRSWLIDSRHLQESGLGDGLYTLQDSEAVAHLLAVAGGLDSLVPGEPQIVAQLKQAHALAAEAGAARAVVAELVEAALHVAKHIRSETGIGAGKVSVASVALDFVQRVFGTLAGRCVLSIGAGKMNEIMLRQLTKLGPAQVLLANRSAEKARELATGCGGRAVPFDQIQAHLAAADVVLTSTGSPEPIVTAEMVRSAQGQRDYRPLLLMDIAVPRDVDAAAGGVENVFLYNIDDLEEIVAQTLHTRRGERHRAARIIDEHVAALTQSLHVRWVSPVIDALYRRMEEIAAEELQAARNKLSTHADAEQDAKILERALHRTIRRILHAPATNLRAGAESDEARRRVRWLRELFGLDDR